MEKKLNFKDMKEDELLSYREVYYPDINKTALKQINQILYEALRTKKLLSKIPDKEKRIRRVWKDKNNDYIIKYYFQNYNNYNKKKLNAHDPGLLYIIKTRGLEQKIWTQQKKIESVEKSAKREIKNSKWKKLSDIGLLDFIKKKHPDVIYREDIIIKDFNLFKEVKKRNFLLNFPKKEKERRGNLTNLDNNQLINVYNKYYKELTRGQLSEIDKPFYSEMLKRGVIDIIPKKRLNKNDFQYISDEQLMNYTKIKYSWLSKKQIKKKNKGLFRELKKRELLKILWPNQNNHKIKSSSQLIEAVNTEPKARYAIEKAVGLSDPKEIDVTVADVLAVVWDGRIERKEIIKMLQEPSLAGYLGNFIRNKKGIGELPVIIDAGKALLPYDKDNMIKELIKRRVERWLYDEYLGAKPAKKEIYSALEKITEQIDRLEMS